MHIKRMLRSTFAGRVTIGIWHEIFGTIKSRLISEEQIVKNYYHRVTGQQLNLESPMTFSEKMNWYKLHGHHPLMVRCADKVEVRQYVIEKGLQNYLNEVYAVYDSVNSIHPENLPQQFVIKAAHGTHMQYVVRDKDAFDWFHSKIIMRTWLRQDISWWGGEWVYKDIPHRLIVEKYLEDRSGELKDYKIFCFNGTPRFIQVDTGRFSGRHVRNFYDMNWNFLPITDDVGSDSTLNVQRPESFEIMEEIAKKLSEPFQFVRVDLYEVDGKPIVGELTFFHNGGVSRMEPEEWEYKIGAFWKLEK